MSHLPNVREAIAHVDETAVSRVRRFHVWAVIGSAAILAGAIFWADVLLPILAGYLPALDVVPGFKALPAALGGGSCQRFLDEVRLAFGMFLVFIPFSWLVYLLLVAPRYLQALGKVAESVVDVGKNADRKDSAVIIDFGWSRDRYRYPDLFVTWAYLIVTLGVLIDSLWFPHLIGMGCAGTKSPIPSFVIECLFGGLLAVTAPHAVVLMLQARRLRRGPRR